jgi:hypothetical protein
MTGGTEMELARWQRWCGWAAVSTAAIWAAKFVLLLVVSGNPGSVEFLTGFVLPSTASVLGLVAVTGLAAPFVVGRSRRTVALASVLVAVGATLAFSALANASLDWSPIATSGNVVVRTEASVLVSAAIFGLVGFFLLKRPRTHDATAAPFSG